MKKIMRTFISAVKSWTSGKIKESTANWNQNDTNANDYVKNRTHWEERTPKGIVVHPLDEKFLPHQYGLKSELIVCEEIMPNVDLKNCGIGAYGNGIAILIRNYYGTSISSTSIYYCSTDGINWEERRFPVSQNYYEIKYINGLFIALGLDSILTSADGINWEVYSFSGYIFENAAYGNGKYVVVGIYGGVCSEDGINWTKISCRNHFSVAYGNGLFVRSSTRYIETSEDGINWTTVVEFVDTSDNPIYYVVYGNNLFLAYANKSTILVSENGTDWTEVTTPLKEGVSKSCYFVNDMFMLFDNITDSGFYYYSTDGENWFPKPSIQTRSRQFSSIFSMEDMFIGISNGHPIMFSKNGMNWSESLLKLTLNGEDITNDILKTLMCNGSSDVVNKDISNAISESNKNKMNTKNPTGIGSFSLNRKENTLIGDYSYSAGRNTTASGLNSSSKGIETVANRKNMEVSGRYNSYEDILYVIDKSLSSGISTLVVSSYYYADSYEFDENTGLFSLINPQKVSNYNDAVGKWTLFSNDIERKATKIRQIIYADYYNSSTWRVYCTELTSNPIGKVEGKYVKVVGNGTSNKARSNAHTLDWEGNAWYAGDVYVGGESQDDPNATKLIQAPLEAEIGQIIAVKAVDENGKPTEWECVPETQADLSMNDANEPSYVKNRTHWTEETNETVWILEETKTTGNPDDAADLYRIGQTDELVLGEEYIVNYNGVDYKCVAHTYKLNNVDYIALGNSVNATDKEPFFILHDGIDNISVVIVLDKATYPTVSIRQEKHTEIIHHLDPKYIKDMYYEECNRIVEILPETTFEGEDVEQAYAQPLGLKVGETYIVKINGTTYENVAIEADLFGLGVNQIFVTDNFEDFDNMHYILMEIPSGMDGAYAILNVTPDGEMSHTVSVYCESRVIHKLDNKFLDLDWMPIEKEKQLIKETMLANESSTHQRWARLEGLTMNDVHHGQKLTVYFDSEPYNVFVTKGGSGTEEYANCGDISVAIDQSYLTIPFYISFLKEYSMFYWADGSQNHTVSIYGVEPNKMPEEYLPDTVIKAPTTAEVGQTIVVEEVDENGKPIKWKCENVSSGGASSPTKLSDLENDLFYNRITPMFTLTKDDFTYYEENGYYRYISSPRLPWFNKPKDLGFVIEYEDGYICNHNMGDYENGGFDDGEYVISGYEDSNPSFPWVFCDECGIGIGNGHQIIGDVVIASDTFEIFSYIPNLKSITFYLVDVKKVPIEFCDTTEIEDEIANLTDEVYSL